MKKLIAILLSTAMLVTMLAVMAIPAAAAGTDIAVNAFNPESMVAGVSAIYTQAYTVDGYQEHLAFELVSDNTYKVVDKSSYDWNETDGDILSSALAIPANGFVWCIQWIADNEAIGTAQAFAKGIQIGQSFVVEGLDLAAGTYTTVVLTEVGGSSEDDTTSGADYDTTGNIALNKEVTGEGYGNYTADLTDGKAANAVAFDNSWFAFCKEVIDENGGSNDGNAPDGVGSVVVDLGAVYDLASFKVNALYGQNIEESGINSPAKISAYVAETADGEYTYVGDLTADATEGTAWATLEAAAKGQFVKIEVTTDGLFAFINEIAVYEAAASGDENTGDENTGDENTGDENTGDENTGDENTGDENTGDEDTKEPAVDVEDLVGAENEDAAFTADITVPETYLAGEEVVVTVTINNVTAETGLHKVELNLFYDESKLELANAPTGTSTAVSAFKALAEWEDFTKVKTTEDGANYIFVSAGTAGNEDGTITTVKEDGQLVFEVKFIAKADATGDIVVYGTNESVKGDYVGETIASYVGNTNSATIAEGKAPVEPSDDETTPDQKPEDKPEDKPTDVEPGDASSMIFFAIIALVAIAGSAVVIKTRK